MPMAMHMAMHKWWPQVCLFACNAFSLTATGLHDSLASTKQDGREEGGKEVGT